MEKGLRIEIFCFLLAFLIFSGCSALTPGPDKAQSANQNNDSVLAMDYDEEEDDNFD